MGPVLFISHSAGRTGAPLMLLNALRWLKANSDLEFEVLLKEGGALYEDFASIAPTRVLESDNAPSIKRRLLRKLVKSGEPATESIEQLATYYKESGVSLIYANTVTLGSVLEGLACLPCNVITHIHEMDHWIDRCGPENLALIEKHSDFYIAASQAVKRNWMARTETPDSRIKVINSFVTLIAELPDPSVIANLAQKLGIQSTDSVVVSSGFETWRKGKDLFLELGTELKTHDGSRHWKLLWVGGWEDPDHQRQAQAQIIESGMENNFIFVDDVANPLDYFSLGDVFVLLSREEPLGLVALEASMLGKPVVCFSDAGGMSDFVGDDHGIAVPYLSVKDVAEAVLKLVTEPELANELSRRAKQKIAKDHNIAAGSQAMLKVIREQQSDRR